MELLISFPSISRLWNSLYASDKRIERAPKVREFNPWEIVDLTTYTPRVKGAPCMVPGNEPVLAWEVL
jgi:hypothetical protein